MFRTERLVASLALCVAGCGAGPEVKAFTNEVERTLTSCDTSVASEVPAFFAKYFRCVTVRRGGGGVVVESQGLPPHKSFYYASGSANHVAYASQGEGYYQNPNSIAVQSLRMVVPDEPVPKGLTVDASMVDGVVGSSFEEYGMGAAGIALDSVAIFNPLAAPGDDIEDEKWSFDLYSGHPEPRGTYHYHTTTSGPLEVLVAAGLTTSSQPGQGTVEAYGMMCDGTVVMGCTELDGATPDASDLDAQNGHVHDLVDEAGVTHFTGRYHTHVCPGVFDGHRFTPEIQYYEDCSI